MLGLAGPDFRFSAKLARSMTHEIDPKLWRNQVNLYKQGIAPLPVALTLFCGVAIRFRPEDIT
jgi:uncharacterized protein YecE (DUF72 family)